MHKQIYTYPVLVFILCLFTGIGTAKENKDGPGHHAGSIGESPIERTFNAEWPTVVFYKLPNCGICVQIDRWLVKLDADHPESANYIRKNSTDETLHPEMNARGIQHHGVVFLDTKTNVMWAAQAHGLRQGVLEAAFAEHVESD